MNNQLSIFDTGHFAEVKTNNEYHSNGQLAYTETVAVLKPEIKHLYLDASRVHPEGYSWIRVGLNAKYHDNGLLAWELNYNDAGKLIGGRQGYRKDGTPIIN